MEGVGRANREGVRPAIKSPDCVSANNESWDPGELTRLARHGAQDEVRG